jgi:serine protease Do
MALAKSSVQFDMTRSACSLFLVAVAFGQPPTIDLDGFSKSVQTEALCATVRINNAKKKSVGSGVLLGKSGPVAYVLTAAHVVADAEAVEVHVFSKETFPKARIYATAKVIARRRENNQDLALLRIADFREDLKTLSICKTANVPKDKALSALAVGCGDFQLPKQRADSVRAVLAAKPGDPKPARFWQSVRKPTAGDSGGPIVNTRGELLGICSGGQGKHGYYCHLEDIHAFLRSSGLNWVLEPKP